MSKTRIFSFLFLVIATASTRIATSQSLPEEATMEPSIELPVAPDRTRPASEPTERGVFEGKAGTFEFVAADQASLQVARKIGREVLEVCDFLMTPPLERIPTIEVKLAPDGRGNLEERMFDIYTDLAGDYGVAVRWNARLPASVFIEALTESYLKQLVLTITGRDRAEQVPSWLIAATSLRTQVAFRPELTEFLREIGREMPMPSLESLFAPRSLAEMNLEDRVAAYWFLELLRDSLGTQKRVRAYFDAIVMGGDPIGVLEARAEGLPGFGNGVEMWWVVGFQDLVNEESGIVFSIDRSGKLLFLLSRFEIVRPTGLEYAGSVDLWTDRQDPVIRREVSNRLQGVQALLPRINPVFFNSLRGLGLVLQALLDDNKEEFDRVAAEFSDEIERASALAKEALTLANDPGAEIDSSEPVPRPRVLSP